ncbi:MAG: hypothetical protein KDK72_03520 [Chlamydiia bacterium]|nr:hypothetical protein [Chlamydiia bacterium]
MSGPLTAVVNRDSESSVNSQKRITENCGVCGKPGVEVYWYSSMSRGAHTVCYGKIEEIQRDLIKKN